MTALGSRVIQLSSISDRSGGSSNQDERRGGGQEAGRYLGKLYRRDMSQEEEIRWPASTQGSMPPLPASAGSLPGSFQ